MTCSISVIVPVFNDQESLNCCLEALEIQRYPAREWEVIIVDNGSTVPVKLPVTPSLNVRLISEPTPGAYAARNAGWKVARGKMIAFTDADCLPEPGWLMRGREAVLATRSRSVVGGSIQMYIPTGKRRTAAALYDLCIGLRQEKYWRVDGFFVTANMFVPAALFQEVGLFTADLFSGADAEWCRRAVAKGHSLYYAADACVKHPTRLTWRGVRYKVHRDAQGGKSLAKMEMAYRRGRRFARLAESGRVITRIWRERRLRGAKEKFLVYFMIGVVVFWKLEGRLRYRLTGKRNR